MTISSRVAARHAKKTAALAPRQVSLFMRKIPTYIQQRWKQKAKASINVSNDALSAIIDVTLPGGSFIEIDIKLPNEMGEEYVEDLTVMAYPKGGRGTQTLREKNVPFKKLIPSNFIDRAMQELVKDE